MTVTVIARICDLNLFLWFGEDRLDLRRSNNNGIASPTSSSLTFLYISPTLSFPNSKERVSYSPLSPEYFHPTHNSFRYHFSSSLSVYCHYISSLLFILSLGLYSEMTTNRQNKLGSKKTTDNIAGSGANSSPRSASLLPLLSSTIGTNLNYC